MSAVGCAERDPRPSRPQDDALYRARRCSPRRTSASTSAATRSSSAFSTPGGRTGTYSRRSLPAEIRRAPKPGCLTAARPTPVPSAVVTAEHPLWMETPTAAKRGTPVPVDPVLPALAALVDGEQVAAWLSHLVEGRATSAAPRYVRYK